MSSSLSNNKGILKYAIHIAAISLFIYQFFYPNIIARCISGIPHYGIELNSPALKPWQCMIDVSPVEKTVIVFLFLFLIVIFLDIRNKFKAKTVLFSYIGIYLLIYLYALISFLMNP